MGGDEAPLVSPPRTLKVVPVVVVGSAVVGSDSLLDCGRGRLSVDRNGFGGGFARSDMLGTDDRVGLGLNLTPLVSADVLSGVRSDSVRYGCSPGCCSGRSFADALPLPMRRGGVW